MSVKLKTLVLIATMSSISMGAYANGGHDQRPTPTYHSQERSLSERDIHSRIQTIQHDLRQIDQRANAPRNRDAQHRDAQRRDQIKKAELQKELNTLERKILSLRKSPARRTNERIASHSIPRR